MRLISPRLFRRWRWIRRGTITSPARVTPPAFPGPPAFPAGTVTPFGSIEATSAAFLTKISAVGVRILYSTRISGHQKNCDAGSSCFLSSRSTAGRALAVDTAGNAYLAGNTDTADLPTT